MDVTQIEKDHGIQFISDMTLTDFLKLIDAKTTELNEKVAKYLKDSSDDINNWKNCSPHEVSVITDMHKSYTDSMQAALEDLKEVATKSLNKNYTVPCLLIETFMEIARKTTTLHYVKLQPSHVRIA
jgi:DNA phosphorothioation-dependent restriction protein DptG